MVVPWRSSRSASEVFAGPPIDLTDFDVESNDGEHIGKIDEATYESGITTWSSTPATGSSARSACFPPAS